MMLDARRTGLRLNRDSRACTATQARDDSRDRRRRLACIPWPRIRRVPAIASSGSSKHAGPLSRTLAPCLHPQMQVRASRSYAAWRQCRTLASTQAVRVAAYVDRTLQQMRKRARWTTQDLDRLKTWIGSSHIVRHVHVSVVTCMCRSMAVLIAHCSLLALFSGVPRLQ